MGRTLEFLCEKKHSLFSHANACWFFPSTLYPSIIIFFHSPLDLSNSLFGPIPAPHQGQLITKNLFSVLYCANKSLNSFAPASVLGVASPPIQTPILISSFPNIFSFSVRIFSQAQISVDALKNCCVVSNRRVYLIITTLPVEEGFKIFLRNITNADNPRYASVFPPPVGNHIKSIIFLSSLKGSVKLFIFSIMNAI